MQCDGCASEITSCWYHNLDIDADFDLCSTCFTSEQTILVANENNVVHVLASFNLEQ